MRGAWLSLAVLFTSCGGATPPCEEPVATRSALIGGATTDTRPSVVALWRRESCRADVFCSATVLAPDRVVTAAHCVAHGDPEQIWIGRAADELFGVRSAWTHPAYDAATWANDVALIEPVDPLPQLASPLGGAALAVGDPLEIAGFGVADDGPPGELRTGVARLAELGAGELTYEPDPAMTCAGDSGGPVFVGEDLVAVTSRGDAQCVRYGKGTLTEPLRDFLELSAGTGGRRR